MGCEHDAPAALGLELLPLVVDRYGQGLIVGEQEQVGPLLDQGGRLLLQLQLPPVIRAHLVRLFKFPHHSVGRQHHVDAVVHGLLQGVQEPPELLGHIDVALAVSHVFNPGDALAVTDTGDAQLLRPVRRINYQCGAQARVCFDAADQLQEHGPAGGALCPLHVHVPGASLRVDEQGPGELGGKGRFPDPFRAVNHNLHGSAQLTRYNL